MHDHCKGKANKFWQRIEWVSVHSQTHPTPFILARLLHQSALSAICGPLNRPDHEMGQQIDAGLLVAVAQLHHILAHNCPADEAL
jgi:hypothetical protein